MVTLEKLHKEIEEIKSDVGKILIILEEDALLSAEDIEALKEAREGLAKGRTVPFEKVKES